MADKMELQDIAAEAVRELAKELKGDAVGWLEITVDDVDEAAEKVLRKLEQRQG